MKISEAKLKDYEQSYPGITEQINARENAGLPACAHCGSADTAVVIGALIGRSLGSYYCNACKTYFNLSSSGEMLEAKTKPIFLRPCDDSWQAFRDWVLALTSAITGKKADDTHTEAEWKQNATTFWAKAEESH